MVFALVTGAGGFIGSHIIRLLLAEGHSVRGTVRDLSKANFLHDLPNSVNLELVEADLLRPEDWPAACKGVDVVFHVASVFKIGLPDDQVVTPAVDGTHNVLSAAADAAVQRVIVTSSIAAICGGHPKSVTEFTADMWGDPDAALSYDKAKMLGEREAWAIAEKRGLRLLVVNPGFTVGPLLDVSQGKCESSVMIRELLEREIPMVPDFHLPRVDVRDVAEAHIRLLDYEHPDMLCFYKTPALGRFVVVSSASLGTGYIDWCRVLQANFGDRGFVTPTRVAPRCLLKIMSIWDSRAATGVKISGVRLNLDGSKTSELLGVQYRDPDAALVAHAQSLLDLGVVKSRN
ncbi:MAG: uncharacterized protein KVP18_002576 [Porospora cf. gigantea A]|uniref:uncharacterized protein n=2 Tax=Porospora cf. gigantea A TaxID=2853593 RepID=UPI00355A57F7|nr:MAG: hypothetical protein KVP18_002576 [Porospora cf. gigantea A]